jgi:hypothetical protein
MATVLDSVAMKELHRTVAYGGGLPVVTHEGTIDIGEFTFHVYQLSTGQRIIPCEEIDNFFEALSGAESKT